MRSDGDEEEPGLTVRVLAEPVNAPMEKIVSMNTARDVAADLYPDRTRDERGT